MEVKSVEKKEKSIVEFVVEVNGDEYGAALGKAVRKIKNRVTVPGFRKGKAPRAVIERLYGALVFQNDALDILMPDVLSFLVKQPDVKVIDVPQVTDIDFKDGENGADITLEAPFWPDVNVGEYKGISAPKPGADVSDDEVDREINGIRLRNARFETVERPAVAGDITVIDYKGFIDGEEFDGGSDEGHELELGSNSFIPGFEEKLEGMRAGENREIDLVFPENYTEQMAGKPVTFKVSMAEVRERQLPEPDDEFAKDVSEFDTFAEFKADIREKQEKRKQSAAEDAFEDALLGKIVDALDVEVPDFLTEQQMDNSMKSFARRATSYGMEPSAYFKMMNTTPELFRERMRDSCEKQVKTMLALQKIAELEGIEVNAEDIEKEYAEAAAQSGVDIEEIKESADDERTTIDIKMRRAARLVIENAVAEDVKTETGANDENDGVKKKPSAKPAEKKAPAARRKKSEAPETESEGFK